MGLRDEECLDNWEERHYCKKHDTYYEEICYKCKMEQVTAKVKDGVTVEKK